MSRLLIGLMLESFEWPGRMIRPFLFLDSEPAIATGVYGFPRDEAARIAVTTVAAHLATNAMPERVIFVCFDEATVDAYRHALGMIKS